jgi:hypothetical protein
MAELRVTSNFADLEKYLKGRGLAVQTEGEALSTRMVAAHTQRMIKSFRGYTGPRNTGTVLQKRTGSLRNAMRWANETAGKDVRASSYVAGPISYARIQELGGVIRPRQRKYLTIPTPAVLTRAGVVRQGARPTKVGGTWMTAQKIPGLKLRETFIRRSKKGAPVIYGTGTDGEPVALWVLRKSVRIPPRLGFFAQWQRLGPVHAAMLEKAGAQILEDRRG